MQKVTKKRLRELLEQTDNRLEKFVIEDLLDQDEPGSYLEDVLNHGCQSGIVGGLIYYVDTKKFFVDYMDEIEDLEAEMVEMIGEPLKKGSPYFNWSAWFGYEETARKIAGDLGLEI